MNRFSDRWLKATLLIAFSIFLSVKFASGQLYYYIGPRFAWLAIVAAGIFIFLALAYLTPHTTHEHSSIWSLSIIAIPLALGLVVPAQPLSATAVANQNPLDNTNLASNNANFTVAVVPSQRNILDWARALGKNPDSHLLEGQPVDVIGFVYRDIRFANDQFMVTRFTITCCVADSLALGLVTQAPNASQFQTNAWVQVKGAFAPGVLNNAAMPVVQATEIISVTQPAQPYLYP